MAVLMDTADWSTLLTLQRVGRILIIQAMPFSEKQSGSENYEIYPSALVISMATEEFSNVFSST